MGKTNFKMDLRPMNRQLKQLRDRTPEERDRVLHMAAELITAEAKSLSPVARINGGTLRDSHTWEKGPGEGQATLGANTTYAAAVHARHPTKAGWFQQVLVGLGPQILRKCMATFLSKGPSGGGAA